MKYKTRITQMTILQVDETLLSETATIITIEDDGAGEYLSIFQPIGSGKDAIINIDPDEWLVMRSTIDRMFADIKENQLSSDS
jgi:hypothetical protein